MSSFSLAASRTNRFYGTVNAGLAVAHLGAHSGGLLLLLRLART